jgi:hypothetical protein
MQSQTLPLLKSSQLPHLNSDPDMPINYLLSSYCKKLTMLTPKQLILEIETLLKAMDDDSIDGQITDSSLEHAEYDRFFQINRVFSYTPIVLFFRSLLICHLAAFQHMESNIINSDVIDDQLNGMKANIDLLLRVINNPEEV